METRQGIGQACRIELSRHACAARATETQPARHQPRGRAAAIRASHQPIRAR